MHVADVCMKNCSGNKKSSEQPEMTTGGTHDRTGKNDIPARARLDWGDRYSRPEQAVFKPCLCPYALSGHGQQCVEPNKGIR